MEQRMKALLRSPGFYAVLLTAVLSASLIYGVQRIPPVAELPETEPAASVQTMPETEAPVPRPTPEPTPVQVLPPPEEPEKAAETAAPVLPVEPALVVSPLQGEVVAAFSMDALRYDETLADWRTHDGIDIAARRGTAVAAASAGTVLSIEDDPLMGTTVVLGHRDGYETTYANLQVKPPVELGDHVNPGEVIGAVGATAAAESSQGPHLHFSVSKDGETVDPNAYLKG